MKKQLLATTALVGASLLVTGNAWAQASPIQMGVKGYWRMFVEYVDAPSSDNRVLAPFNPAANGVTTYTGTTGTANTRGHFRSFVNDIESRTFFVGEGKLDNGITPGVNIQFETFNRNGSLPSGGSAAGTNAANGFFGNQERRARGYLKSAWGEIGMGNVDNIERLNAVYEAIANLLGVDSPSGIYPLGTVSTYNDPAGGATRLYYMSPKFAGFDFGVSYAPDAQSDVRSNNGNGGFMTQDGIGSNRYAGAWSQNYTLMARYIGQIGAFGLGGDYGYTGSSNECSGRVTAGVANFSAGCVGADKNVFMHTVRGYVTYAGFRLGMSYQIAKNINGNNQDRETFAPGLDYTTGPWTFGVYYGHGNYDGLRAPLSGTGAALGPAVISTDKLDMISPSVVYLLGPGVRLEASYAYQKYKYGVNASYRNASDFGFSGIGSQTANEIIFGATFAY
jgi:hypothetical protein